MGNAGKCRSRSGAVPRVSMARSSRWQQLLPQAYFAVAHAHRGPAYETSRYVIEQLKQRVPIWKLEYYVDGSREWVGTGKRIRGAARAVIDASGEPVVLDTPAPGDVA